MRDQVRIVAVSHGVTAPDYAIVSEWERDELPTVAPVAPVHVSPLRHIDTTVFVAAISLHGIQYPVVIGALYAAPIER